MYWQVNTSSEKYQIGFYIICYHNLARTTVIRNIAVVSISWFCKNLTLQTLPVGKSLCLIFWTFFASWAAQSSLLNLDVNRHNMAFLLYCYKNLTILSKYFHKINIIQFLIFKIYNWYYMKFYYLGAPAQFCMIFASVYIEHSAIISTRVEIHLLIRRFSKYDSWPN